uniref:Stereocilin LRR domain-containing protein n=1 Tax=Takifugu rubripes TaxID=31033 RepID=H2VAI1_TAKRU
KNLPSLSKRIDRHRLSGFLYNISLYLQEMGAELEEAPSEPEENQLWEKLLHFILQGSPHWDWFLGLLQGLISLSERQPHRSILTYLSENWRTVSAVLEVVLQALISGTYGQASAGLQGFICALKGDVDCAFSVSWLQPLLSSLFGRLKPFTLVQSLDELRKGLLHRVGSSVYDSLKKKASRVTMVLLDDISSLVEVPQPRTQGRCSVGEGIRHNVTWNAQALAVTSQGLANSFPFLTCPSSGSGQQKPASSHQKELEYTSIEILEAACNESIPGLTGVSNFTVFLYCKLFEGENGSIDPAAAQMGLDLHTTCSDAAWYLSAAEEDFLWVHVCSEFFAHEFNNTVCSNSSFWLQRSPRLDKNCLADLGNGLFNAQTFRHCFLPNSSVLISALCGRDSPDSHHSAPEDSWAAAYCYKVKNTSLVSAAEEACQYRKWGEHHFTNATLLERCGQTHGLREHVCFNATLYSQLLETHPHAAAFCADLEAELEDKNCFLRRFFDMLPAPYEFDTSQLCVDPAPLLVEAVHKLSVCGLEGGEREGFLVVLGYVLRVLDFMVGLSSGLDEGENEARQGLGQAILLSSLVDNTSWTKVEPEASTSILQTVGVFLHREQNATVKEDLLSCFSVRIHTTRMRTGTHTNRNSLSSVTSADLVGPHPAE